MARPRKGWESDDGTPYNTRAEAERHDAKAKVGAWMEEKGIGCGGEWNSRMIEGEILEDAERLSVLLHNYHCADTAVAKERGPE